MAVYTTQAQHARMMQMVSRPASIRPLSAATSIDASSDHEEPKRRTAHWQARKQSMLRRTTHEDEASEAESFESLTSRAKAMEHMLSDSDSSIDSRRFSTDNHSMSTLSSEGPGTPRSPAPEYSVEFPENMGEYLDEKASYRRMSMNEAPMYVEKPREMTMTTVGPVGPHLFRSYSTSHASPVSSIYVPPANNAVPPSPSRSRSSRHSPRIGVHDVPTPSSEPESLVSPRDSHAQQVSIEEVRMWSTSQVCEWMMTIGFELELVQKFHANDISGAILVDLKWNDLKELDINSFGKRIELWTEIHHLIARDVPAPMSPDTAFVRPSSRLSRHSSNRSPISPVRGRSGSDASMHSQTMIIRNAPEPEIAQRRPEMISEEETDVERSHDRAARPRHQVRRRSKRANVRIPRRQISVDSIVITSEDGTDFEEGFVVRPRRTRSTRQANGERSKSHRHKHHKHRDQDGEPRRHKCSKGERCPKHNKRSRRAERERGRERERERQQELELPEDSSPTYGTILIAATPSIADHLENQALRQSMMSTNSYLASSDVLGPIHGREVRLQESTLREISRIDPLDNVKAFLSLQEVQHQQESRDIAPPVPEKSPATIQRAFQPQVSPPMVRSHTAPLRPSTPPDISVPPRGMTPAFGLRHAGLEQAQPPTRHQSPPQRLRTPKMMRTTTPFSEADIPVLTASPVYVREQSSSVPPDLHHRQRYPTPTMETLVHGRRPRIAPLNVVDENAEWEALDDDNMKMAPSPSTRTHSGWMKKRRTNWFRHEWPDYHFVLRGTHLGYSKDVATAELGHIDMDDFQVACTASNSTKLAAAFKAHRIFGRKKDEPTSANSYFFQLVPANDNGARAKKNLGKAHFFAVGTREERIDWMRELMLAKAIKAKNQGFSVEVNGKRV